MSKIVNDEPCSADGLDRAKFAGAISHVIAQCDTPLVLGLYGTWGVGKTSLMRIIEQQLSASGAALTVWFDAWQHQFDENPAVALLHTMVDDLGLGEEGRRLLRVIAGALGSVLLKASTNLNASELAQIQEKYDEQRFLVREKQIRLRQHFAELLAEATGNGRLRVVFFIDDLDRCVPEKILEVLEALKLFLNMPGCVYVLGVDRAALETSIRHRYAGAEVSEVAYLDKIVQLPFSIPPISTQAGENFISTLLPEELKELAGNLAVRLGENPRQVKRFVNSLILNHELAKETLRGQYRPDVLAAVLLLQYKNPEVFKQIVKNPAIILDGGADGESSQAILSGEVVQYLVSTVRSNSVRSIDPYVFLSEVAGARNVGYDVVLTAIGDKRIQVIKEIRAVANLPLKEAKEITDSTPSVVVGGLSKDQAEKAANMLTSAGATVEIK